MTRKASKYFLAVILCLGIIRPARASGMENAGAAGAGYLLITGLFVAYPFIPAGTTTLIGNSLRGDSPKGKFGFAYLGALTGVIASSLLVYVVRPESRWLIWTCVIVGSFAGAYAGYALSTPADSGSGGGTPAANVHYFQFGNHSF